MEINQNQSIPSQSAIKINQNQSKINQIPSQTAIGLQFGGSKRQFPSHSAIKINQLGVKNQ